MDINISNDDFSIYDPYTTAYIPLGILSLLGLSIGLSVFFIYRFLIITFDPVAFLLLAILLCPWVYVFVEASQNGLIERLIIRLKIDSSGIHCHKLGHKQFSIVWDEIHVYGILDSSFSYVEKKIIFFSLDKQEHMPKNSKEVNKISPRRIILQYRDGVWTALACYLPSDMKRKLDYSLKRNEGCFHKR